MRFLYTVIFVCGSLITMAQEREVIPPTQTREADVYFSKRIWRIIDLREKQNKIIAWPKGHIGDILYDAVMAQQLKPYLSDSLKSVYDFETFSKRGTNKELVRKLIDPNDPDGRYTTDTVYTAFVPQERVTQLLLVEDWYFDKRMSKEFPRILAIAPLFSWQIEGYDLGMQPLCFVKYFDRFEKETDVRDILVKKVMFNPNNSRSQFTLDDWFEQRRFGSFIVKTSNQNDLNIMDDPEVKRNGLEALIEAERQKQETHQREINLNED